MTVLYAEVSKNQYSRENAPIPLFSLPIPLRYLGYVSREMRMARYGYLYPSIISSKRIPESICSMLRERRQDYSNVSHRERIRGSVYSESNPRSRLPMEMAIIVTDHGRSRERKYRIYSPHGPRAVQEIGSRYGARQHQAPYLGFFSEYRKRT